MGKKKSKKNKHILPKRIAGVKLPKQLRKSGNSLLAMAHDPKTGEFIASALAVAAAAFAKSEAGGKATHGMEVLKDKRPDSTQELVQKLGTALNSAMQHWFGGRLEWHSNEAPADGAATHAPPATQH